MYATQQDMIDRFGEVEMIQLTDRVLPATGAIVDAVVDKALADAGDLIDSYLQGKYTLPIADPPAVLGRYESEIARYFIYDDRVTERVRTRYEDAVKWLRLVAEGKIGLGLDSGDAAAPQTGTVKTSAADRVFTADSLSDF